MRWHSRAVGLALVLAACSGGQDTTANRTAYGAYDENGTASWYGEELDGNLTASGEAFEPDEVTVAHRTLPLNSFVEVTSLTSGRSVVARVNDRGPGRTDRIIDLSRGAKRLLGSSAGLSPVRVRALASPTPTPAVPAPTKTTAATVPLRLDRGRRYGLQVASFVSRPRARALADRLGGDVMAAHGVFRVPLGPFGAGRVQAARDAMAARGYGDAQVLALD